LGHRASIEPEHKYCDYVRVDQSRRDRSACQLRPGVHTRGGHRHPRFGYGANNNLGYTWNNQGNTFGFGYGSPGYPDEGLRPPSNQWSLVACVITPTNAILYLLNTNGQFSATNSVTHTNGAWASLTTIGDDPSSTGGTATTGRVLNSRVHWHH
jgi:hypothetical protein